MNHSDIQTRRRLGGDGNGRAYGVRHLVLCIVCVSVWRSIIASTRLLSSTVTTNYDGNIGNLPSNHQRLAPLHVAYALSGNHPGVLSEFEVSLKSALLNAPLERKLFVHILADQEGYESIDNVTNRTELATWITRNQIEIRAYDLTPHLPLLEKKIKDTFITMDPNFQVWTATAYHTIGTFFRLISHLAIPSSVKHLVYIDTDVIIMSNLEGLLRQVQTKPDALFHWGEGMNAGFLVLNVPRMENIWTLARESPLKDISTQYKQNVNDQLVFMSVNVTHPNEVNILESGWEMVATLRWWFDQTKMDKLYPNTGMLHFNGGSANKEAYFNDPDNWMSQFPNTWGNGKYYVTLPWTWARYQARTMVAVGSNGYLIKICSVGSAGSNNLTLGAESVCV